MKALSEIKGAVSKEKRENTLNTLKKKIQFCTVKMAKTYSFCRLDFRFMEPVIKTPFLRGEINFAGEITMTKCICHSSLNLYLNCFMSPRLLGNLSPEICIFTRSKNTFWRAESEERICFSVAYSFFVQ